MKKRVQIGAKEMISLMVLFEMGTSMMSIPGRNAGKDAWIAILISAIFGALLFVCYGSLHQRFPNLLMTQYCRTLLGKKAGNALAFLYIVFFLYGGARDLRDTGILIADRTLQHTPLTVICALMIGLVMYVVYLGIEVAGRTAIIMLILLLLLGLATNILVLLAGIVDVGNILPIAEHGWQPIWQVVYSQAVMLPYGEMVTFAMILPTLKKGYRANGVGVSAILLGGLLLSMVTLSNVLALGEDVFKRATYPLLSMISKVEISDFIDRVDVIGVMSVIIFDFFKIFIFYYAAVKAAEDVLRVSYHKLILPFGIIMLVSCVLMALSYQDHLQTGELVLKWLFPIFAVFFPILLLIVSWLRKTRNKKGEENVS
ncbi:GerAB/ArcD/ProY family transporter [Paenibacillus polymyxa]|uniref:GerAB/ArcD/ProY family transporter n=1 Tax=Paenibacillus polymyxa TaxID=1406 RepID=UPI002024125F|nr:GerAB/ArcD/ProY family transporter [Paenibacillus polymyxa]WDZ55190.1 GerAB/ArcD/ProY family transporter [Paenibacillus polymyxa]